MLNKLAVKWAIFKNDENGASAIEYAVMAAILIGLIALALGFLDLDGIFTTITTDINAAEAGPGT